MRCGASALLPAGRRSRLAILMYHRVLPAPDPLTGEVDVATFDFQMATLKACFNVLPLSEAVERLQRGTLPPRCAAITFDDGYADNVNIALPILRRHGLHATFFVATGYLNGGRMFNDTVIESIRHAQRPSLDVPAAGLRDVPVRSLDEKRAALARILGAVKYLEADLRAQAVAGIAEQSGARLSDHLMMDDEQVRQLVRSGMEVGGHTVSHPILARTSTEQARQEIRANRDALEAIVGRRLNLFAYPNGVPSKDYEALHVALVREAGYVGAVSTSHGAARHGDDVFQLPRFTPWDRTPARFVARLLRNALFEKPVVLSGIPSVATLASGVAA